LVEPNPKEKSVNYLLFASSKGVFEPMTGLRHVLEHLVVEGKDGKLDARLEEAGAFLKAQTTRDFMEISISCDPNNAQIGLEAIAEILGPRKWSDERIKHEVEVISQEAALEEESSKLAAAAWHVAFGAAGLDPIGDLSALPSATSQEIEAVRSESFLPSNLVLVIEGPVKLNAGTDDGRMVFAGIKPGKSMATVFRSVVSKSGREVIDGFGEARGVVVPGISEPATAASLAGALAIASLVPDSFVTYTPSTQAAVITVGNTNRRNVIGRTIDGLEAGEGDGLFQRGRALAYRWLRRQLDNSLLDAQLRGQLMVQSPGARPEALEQNIVHLTLAQFQAALARLGHDQALVAVGGGQ
jgi:predicted Zn-dependent peptidase